MSSITDQFSNINCWFSRESQGLAAIAVQEPSLFTNTCSTAKPIVCQTLCRPLTFSEKVLRFFVAFFPWLIWLFPDLALLFTGRLLQYKISLAPGSQSSVSGIESLPVAASSAVLPPLSQSPPLVVTTPLPLGISVAETKIEGSPETSVTLGAAKATSGLGTATISSSGCTIVWSATQARSSSAVLAQSITSASNKAQAVSVSTPSSISATGVSSQAAVQKKLDQGQSGSMSSLVAPGSLHPTAAARVLQQEPVQDQIIVPQAPSLTLDPPARETTTVTKKETLTQSDSLVRSASVDQVNSQYAKRWTEEITKGWPDFATRNQVLPSRFTKLACSPAAFSAYIQAKPGKGPIIVVAVFVDRQSEASIKSYCDFALQKSSQSLRTAWSFVFSVSVQKGCYAYFCQLPTGVSFTSDPLTEENQKMINDYVRKNYSSFYQYSQAQFPAYWQNGQQKILLGVPPLTTDLIPGAPPVITARQAQSDTHSLREFSESVV